MPTIKELVIRQLEVDPDISLKACISVVPGLKKSNFYKIKKEWKLASGQVDKKRKPRGSTQRGKTNNSSIRDTPSHPHAFSKEELINKLSSPVEFVQSIIVEELMKTRDVRWAQLFTTILDKTKKLDYNTINEQKWLSQAKSMTMDDIVNGIAIKGSISKSMSRRLENLEDTSPYDSF